MEINSFKHKFNPIFLTIPFSFRLCFYKFITQCIIGQKTGKMFAIFCSRRNLTKSESECLIKWIDSHLQQLAMIEYAMIGAEIDTSKLDKFQLNKRNLIKILETYIMFCILKLDFSMI